MSLTITPIYLAIVAVLLVALSFKIISLRRSLKVSIGDKGHDNLAYAVRTHGNLTEYIPIAMLLLAAFELNGGNPWLVHGVGAALVLGRFFHAGSFLTDSMEVRTGKYRVLGMMLTFLSILVLSLANLYMIFL